MSATAVPSQRPAARSGARATPRRASAAGPARRVSGPVGGRSRSVPAPRHGVALGGRAVAVVRGLPDHSVIDRLVRSRAWIPVLGVLLAGIVAMQVEILKLGTNIGRSIERSTTLRSQNELLQANVAALSDDQRIERLAAGMGMVMSSPTEDVFLTAHPGGDAGRAVANIHAPDPTDFAAQLAAQIQAAAALMPSSSGTSQSASGVSSTSPDLTPGLPTTSATAAATPSGTGGTSDAASATTPSSPASSAATTTPSPTQPAGPTTTTVSAGSAPAAGTGATLATGAAAPVSSQSGAAASG